MKEDTTSMIGKRIPKGHQLNRDAIHIAVLPMIAGQHLKAGERIRLKFGTKNIALSAECGGKYLGVVDPFFCQEDFDAWINTGDEFLAFLQPGTINGLRHAWTHDELDEDISKLSASERWLRAFACKWGFDYDEMISEARKRGVIVAYGNDLHSREEIDKTKGDEELFWKHLEKISKRKFSAVHRAKVEWRCSC